MPREDFAFEPGQRTREHANGSGLGAEPAMDLIDPASLQGELIPARQWLVADWIPMGRVSALYGVGGEGKTTIAQQLATACAIGGQWLGLPVRQCNSLLLYCEDDRDEMHLRQANINAACGCNFLDLSPMRWLPRLGCDNALMDFHGHPAPTAFFERIRSAAKDHEAQLIVADTLADVFGGNENDRGQARTFVQSVLGRLARELSAAVLVLAHPSRAGMNSGSGESGSTGWLGTFRSQLYLESPKGTEADAIDPYERVLTRKKANAARRDETIELRWDAGVFVAKQAATGILGTIERHTVEHVFLDLLGRVTAEGRYVSEKPRASNYAPKLFAGRPDREGYREGDFKRAMERLFAAREIQIGTFRSPDRHDYACIGRVPKHDGVS